MSINAELTTSLNPQPCRQYVSRCPASLCRRSYPCTPFIAPSLDHTTLDNTGPVKHIDTNTRPALAVASLTTAAR